MASISERIPPEVPPPRPAEAPGPAREEAARAVEQGETVAALGGFSEEQFVDIAYGQAVWTVHFIESKWGKEGLRQFLFALRKSVIGGGDSAYEEAFKLKPDEFERSILVTLGLSIILIHVAEIKKELDDSLAQNHATPVQYMNRIGLLGPDVVSAHCIFVDAADEKTLAQKQVGCVHNPSSNMMIASGVSPVPEMRAAGIAVGLGTDGPAGSNNDLDLMEEIDLAAKLAKITKSDPLALNAKAVVEMATIDGARALHMEKMIGSLEAGKKADLVLIGLDSPNAVPMYEPYAQLAYALKASDVETVIIGGRVVMRDHQLLTVNQSEAVAKAREYKKKIAYSLGIQ